MAMNNGDPRDRGAITGGLGSALSAWSTAGAQLLREGASLVSRGPVQTQGEPPSAGGWINRLLENYRQYLGEMAGLLPLVAQRVSTDPASAAGELLLLQTELKGHRWIEDAAVGKDGGDPSEQARTRVYVTEGAMERLGQELTLSEIPALLSHHDKVQRLPKLLDELKYEVRRRGINTFAAVAPELRSMLDELNQDQEKLNALPRLLGENVIDRIITEKLQKKLGEAQEIKFESFEQLRKQLEEQGIVLSNALSLVASMRHWLLFDHEKDRVYEIRLVKRWLEPYRYKWVPTNTVSFSKDALAIPDAPWLEVYGRQQPRRYTVSYNQALEPAKAGEKRRKRTSDVLLPVRVLDASQGFALWSIDKRLVQEHLDNQRVQLLKAWDIGANRTPLVLFMVDYREGDLGPYFELGLACFAAPRKDPLAVGMMVIHQLPVTSALACQAGREIWGYEKVLSEDLRIEYPARKARCTLEHDGQELVFTLPRRGEGMSASVPMFSYTVKGRSWHRTLITRSGAGETIRGGSGVELQVKGTPASPSSAATLSLFDDLRYFGLIDGQKGLAETPMLSGWTQSMSAQLETPVIIVPNEMGD
jgi:hypothetical protein